MQDVKFAFIQATLERSLCLDALQLAVQQRQPAPGLLHHTDRGSQYASGEYQAALWTLGRVGSMSRRGNCWDNAVAESFATLKAELCERVVFQTPAQARAALFEYIEVFYNRQRLHSALDSTGETVRTPSERAADGNAGGARLAECAPRHWMNGRLADANRFLFPSRQLPLA